MLELREREAVIEETIPEDQVSPNIDLLTKQSVVLEPGLVFGKLWIECALWHANKLVLLR